MYRNYYPYPPVYNMCYTNPYATKKCMHQQYVYPNQQPNPFYAQNFNEQQMMLQNANNFQGQQMYSSNSNNFQGQQMNQSNSYNFGQQQSAPLNQNNYQSEAIPVINTNVNPNETMSTPVNIEDSNNQVAFSHQFLNEQGQVDVNKMLTTVGQLAKTVQQVSPVIKQVNDIIQSFRA